MDLKSHSSYECPKSGSGVHCLGSLAEHYDMVHKPIHHVSYVVLYNVSKFSKTSLPLSAMLCLDVASSLSPLFCSISGATVCKDLKYGTINDINL
jgi:hypothetical protein